MVFYGKAGLNVKKTALTLGSFAAFVHLVWAVLVAVGVGQGLVNWKLNMHFLSAPYTVLPFDIVNAVLLIVLAFVGGAVFGAILATLWNSMPE